MPESDFGALVIGADKVAAFQRQAKSETLIFGSRVVDGAVPVAEVPMSPPPGKTPDEGFSVVSIKKLLLNEPEQFDKLLALEVARPDRRLGALTLFRGAETKRTGGPRQDVLNQIDGMLK